jgi:hypothetical protein
MKPGVVAGLHLIRRDGFLLAGGKIACLLLLWASFIAPIQAEVLRLGNGEGVTTIWSAEAVSGLVDFDNESGVDWKPVALDHSWRRVGWCAAPVTTYRVQFDLETAPRDGLGLFIRRAGNRLSVSINNEQAAEFGSLNNPKADYSNLPLFVPLAWHALRLGTNTVLLQVAGDCRRYAGISHMDIGPREAIEAVQQSARRMRTYPTVGIVSVCGLLTVAGLVFFFLSRNRTALLFGVANGLWALRTALWGMTELPMSYELWFFLIDVTYAGWISLMSVLCLRIASIHLAWLEKLQWVTLAVMAIASIVAAAGYNIWLKQLGLQATMVSGALAMLAVLLAAIRTPREANVAMSFATVPMFVLAVWDHWNVWISSAPDAYQRYYFSPLLVLFMLVAVALLLMRQFQLAMRSDAQYRSSLEAEVERQRKLLEAQHEREIENAQSTAIQVERQRIVRDMHDGLGAQLVGLLATVRSEQTTAETLESEVTDAIEQLRFAIDNLSVTDTDLSMMLAQFRYHHEQRLRRLGVRLVWDVDILPVAPWPARALLELQQMLREVLANSLKHGDSQNLRVRAYLSDGLGTIVVEDDGRGFDIDAVPRGRGLKHLYQRSAQLGIQLSLRSRTSGPGQGTSVRWTWPVEHVPMSLF